MVAIMVFLCCRAATIAASMAVLGPGSDRPAAFGPEAPAEDGGRRVFCPARNAAPSRQGKKAGHSRCGKAIEAQPPLGLDPSIRGCMRRARERTDGDHHDHRQHRRARTWHRRSQRGLRLRINAREGATWRMTAHGYAARRSPWDGAKRPRGEHGSNLGARHDTRPASINSSVKGKNVGFTVIWSYARRSTTPTQ